MSDIGIFGLGVMGRSLALNIARRGFKVSAYNVTQDLLEELMNTYVKDEPIQGYSDLKDFLESLDRPRKIFLMIKSGVPVDETLDKLIPYLDKGDLIIDGGNSHFKDTERRMERLNGFGIYYLGVGVSGGEKGALNGPSIMPGGNIEAYKLVEDILIAISAKTEDGHCCSYMGKGGAGHFVKMVHNGIEYGIMQAIAEAYDILRKVLGLSSEEIGIVFKQWNQGELNSFLMEISYKIMSFEDNETKNPLVEMILDKAGQKGTGRWTAEAALALGIPAPSLTASVDARAITFFKDYRTALNKKINKTYVLSSIEREELIKDLEDALLFSIYLLFSQGMWVINEASKEYSFDINPLEVLRIWKGGCIIRAKLLDFIIEVLKEDIHNFNLLNSEKALDFLTKKLSAVKKVSRVAEDNYLPTFVLSTARDYFFSMIEEDLPANLIQAQRDFFGAHTYSRTDKEGIFHTIWES